MSDDDLQRLSSAGAIAKKKTLIASEQDRPDVAEKRTQWRASQEQIDPAKAVFIDETWAKTNLSRRDGRSPLGNYFKHCGYRYTQNETANRSNLTFSCFPEPPSAPAPPAKIQKTKNSRDPSTPLNSTAAPALSPSAL